MNAFLLWAAALAAASPPPAAVAAPPDVAFVGVSVVPMDRERVLDAQTVVVRGGRIAAVGPSSSTPVPAGALRIEGRGRYLIPGLGDMHTHLGSRADLPLLVANGVTFVRNMWGQPLHLIWRRRIESGALLGPRIFTAGPIVDGKPPIWAGSTAVETAEEAARAVEEQKAAGYDFVKVYSKLSPAAYAAVVESARKQAMPIAGHVPSAVGLEQALAAGQTSIEHLTGYLDAIQRDDSPLKGATSFAAQTEMPRHADEAKVPGVAERTRKAGAWNCLTLTVLARMGALTERADMSATRGLEYVSPATLASWDPATDFRLNDESRRKVALENLPRSRELRGKLVRALRDAGAPLLAGTDFPNPYVVPGFSLHDELALLVEAGLTPYQALKAATADAARFVGLDAGTIEAGRRADLVLIEANPLADVLATRRIEGVLLHGRWLPRSELDALLAQVKTNLAPKDPFAALPPLAGAVRYDLTYNGAPVGAERLVSEGARVRSQSVSGDAWPATDQLVIEGLDLTLEAERDEGPIRVEARGPRVQMRVADLPESRYDRSPGAEAVLMGPWVAAWVPIAARVSDLAVGGSRQLPAYVIEPPNEPASGTLDVTRAPDEGGARVYTFQAKRANAAHEGRLTVDARGLKTVEIKYQIGVVRIQRVE